MSDADAGRGVSDGWPSADALRSLSEHLEHVAARLAPGADREAVLAAAGILRDLVPHLKRLGVLK